MRIFFPFRVDPFRRGLMHRKANLVTKVVTLVIKCENLPLSYVIYYGANFITCDKYKGYLENTDNPLYTDTRYNDKIRYNENLTVMKPSFKR